jgi:hypothetical protein
MPQDFNRTQLNVSDRISARPVMSVVIGDTEHGQVSINGVGVVAVGIMEFDANTERFANAAHLGILSQ